MQAFKTALVILAFWSAGVIAGSLRFSPLPMLDERSLRAQFTPLLEHIEAETGEAIVWRYFPDYADVIEGLDNGLVDFAYLGPLPYVELTTRHDHFAPLAQVREKSGDTSYDCALAHFGDTTADIAALTEKHFALTQPLSTCGSFAVSVMLKRVGLSLTTHGNTYTFTGAHDNAALAVLAGDADVAGLKASITQNYHSLGLEVIATAGPYPGFLFVANMQTLDTSRFKALRHSLLSFEQAQSKDNGGSGQAWPEQGMVRASDADYRRLRADWDAVKDIVRSLQ
jgi:phosphonate transport system substrate-binding protein